MAFCECGNVKNKNAHACERCRFLDGRAKAEQDLIAIMRDDPANGYTLKELVEETGRLERSVHYSLKMLVRTGRLRVYPREQIHSNGFPELVYQLNG